MKYRPSIFDWKQKKARKVKDPRVVSPIKRPRAKKQDVPLDPFTLEPLALTFENLFLSPKEGETTILAVALESGDPLKVPKLSKARKPPVCILLSLVVILPYNKEGDITLRIRDIIEIRSSRGRIIRPTDKKLVIRKKNK
jgi:hypothetical protein